MWWTRLSTVRYSLVYIVSLGTARLLYKSHQGLGGEGGMIDHEISCLPKITCPG